MLSIGRLALLFVLVGLVELVLLVRLGQLIGFWPTAAFVLVTGWAGIVLARLEGMRVLARFQQELAMGKVPSGSILDGAAVLLGGLLLLAPGVLTDVTGLALLLPPTRSLIKRWMRKRLEKGIVSGSIRVLTTVPGMARRTRPEPGAEHGLDPSKGIVIEPKEQAPGGKGPPQGGAWTSSRG